MASLKDIRDAFKTTLEAAIPAVHVYDTVPDATGVLPAVVVIPTGADFNVANRRGIDLWSFNLLVLVSYNDPDLAQDELDDLVSGAGSSSLRQAIFQNRYLGLENTEANVKSMTNYGSRFEEAGISHIGAILPTDVLTKGSE